MGFLIYRLVSLAIFLISWTEFGSSLRVVQKPQSFTFSTEELNISCIADDPSYMTKSILSIQILRHIEDKPIAIINVGDKLKTAVGIRDNVKANGHIDTKSRKGYLTLIIDKPNKQDAGTYRCQMFVIDENFQMVEKNVIGNVTYQEADITGVVTHLTRKLSDLLRNLQTKFIKQNNTMQTLQKQHTTFKNFHNQQRQDMDLFLDKIHAQNNTITEQDKHLEELNDFNTKQRQDIDNLTDKIDRQNNTDMKLIKQIENQNTEIKKQDAQIDKQTKQIENQNTEIKKQDAQIDKQTKQIENQNADIKKQDAQIDKQSKQIETLNSLVDKLNTDSTRKQQQLDKILDDIKLQNKLHKLQLQKINNRALLDLGWRYYKADKTYIKAFGKDDAGKRLTWLNAREVCQSFGGDLVEIRDSRKNSFVYNLFGTSVWTWIGIRNQARRGFDFRFVDGSAMGWYHPWQGTNPHGNKDTNEKCVSLYTGPKYARQWVDDKCSHKYSYVCYVSAIIDL